MITPQKIETRKQGYAMTGRITSQSRMSNFRLSGLMTKRYRSEPQQTTKKVTTNEHE